jgi:hypothetical protein
MKTTDKFPPIPAQLLEELERRFPDKCPDITAKHEDILKQIGQVSVIRFLREQFKRQNETTLPRT